MPILSHRRLGALLCALASLFAVSCGAEYETSKIKSYRMAVVNGDANFKREFRVLIQDFNRHAQMSVLEYVDDPRQANSAIVITEGLRARDGKVGWGQWMSEAQAENPMTKMPGQRARRTVTYSMRVEFDADYFRSRMAEPDQRQHFEKQKLFFHEVGHGLEMDHVSSDLRDVMYPDVSGEKDLAAYFARVRQYMSDR